MKKLKLSQKLSLVISGLLVFMSLSLAPQLAGSSAYAADPKQEACNALNNLDGGGGCGDTNAQTKLSDIVKSVISILSMAVGAVSVIMIIIGGFKYVISNGDANATKSAKDTIMYALIGLLLVGFAQTIVRFVWSKA